MSEGMGLARINDNSLFRAAPAACHSFSPVAIREPEMEYTMESAENKVHALIALQSFHGAWPSSAVGEISAILGMPVGECPREGVQRDVWITLLVVRYLELCMSEEGTWSLVVEKARGWLGEVLGMEALEGLEREAAKLIQSLGQ